MQRKKTPDPASFLCVSDMQEVHALHCQGFGVIVLMTAEIVQRAGIEKGRYGNKAAALVKISPEEELLIDFFHGCRGELMFFYNAPQFVILLAIIIYICNQLRIMQVIAILADKTGVDVGAAQGVVHFSQEN